MFNAVKWTLSTASGGSALGKESFSGMFCQSTNVNILCYGVWQQVSITLHFPSFESSVQI